MPATKVSFLDRERIVAGPGFNRWLVPPAALAVHLCIGMAYGFSVFWKPLQNALTEHGKPLAACSVGATTFADKLAGTGRALTATDCNWTQFDLGWTYTLFFVVLGISAALFGPWLERVGPRRAGLVATACWSGGLLLGAVGVQLHWLWLLWLGTGAIGGIGLGIGYISPVSTLLKWFPDRRGMAAGLAIAGFGGGAMIGSPLATSLMGVLQTADDPGVTPTLVVLALLYAAYMTGGSLGYRLPPKGWQPGGTTVPLAAPTERYLTLGAAQRTRQFWLLWIILCMNVSAAIGIIGAASPMLQETFGGHLIGRPDLGFEALKQNPELLKRAAAVAAGFVGLLSLFNILGRFVWASASDRIGRRNTYVVFFLLGIAMYLLAAHAAEAKSLGLFVACFCMIASMYGGGFATVPAFLADLFGTQFLGAIHGRLLTAWSTAGIVGPVIVNALHDLRAESSIVSTDMIYGSIFWVLASLLCVGFLATLLVTPVADRLFTADDPRVAAALAPPTGGGAEEAVTGSRLGLGMAWLAVLLPLLYGVAVTVQKAAVLFR